MTSHSTYSGTTRCVYQVIGNHRMRKLCRVCPRNSQVAHYADVAATLGNWSFHMRYKSFWQRLKMNQAVGVRLCNACILLKYMSSLFKATTNPFCNTHARKSNE